MRNSTFWNNATPEQRRKLRSIAAANDNCGALLFALAYPLIFGLVFAPMAAVMLARQRELGTYTKTECNGTQDVYYAWCKMLKPPCGRAYTTTVAGQKVRLDFPSYSRHLEQWTTSDYLKWLETVRSPNFTCFVRSAGSTEAVTYIALTGVYGWWFMAGLGSLLLAFAFGCFAGIMFWRLVFWVKMCRLEPELAGFMGQVLEMPYYRKCEYLEDFERARNDQEKKGQLSGSPHDALKRREDMV